MRSMRTRHRQASPFPMGSTVQPSPPASRRWNSGMLSPPRRQRPRCRPLRRPGPARTGTARPGGGPPASAPRLAAARPAGKGRARGAAPGPIRRFRLPHLGDDPC
ncbi:hypothetical protein GCM10010286_30290 [Streptomyces toxytricini]|nr:hypothetical protein GCM10010286_30290 [Streptomyces toxytricini]